MNHWKNGSSEEEHEQEEGWSKKLVHFGFNLCSSPCQLEWLEENEDEEDNDYHLRIEYNIIVLLRNLRRVAMPPVLRTILSKENESFYY